MKKPPRLIAPLACMPGDLLQRWWNKIYLYTERERDGLPLEAEFEQRREAYREDLTAAANRIGACLWPNRCNGPVSARSPAWVPNGRCA